MLRPIAEREPRSGSQRGSLAGPSRARRAVVEGLGTALLLAVVVGSGIMADRLAGGNAALALLANSTATGAGLLALIAAFGEFSGAHLNPLVTVAAAILRRIAWGDVAAYAGAQVLGAFAGVAGAETMFGEPIFHASEKARSGYPLAFAEAVATLGLLLVVFVASRRTVLETAVAVGAYISAAYWFTSSTSFANPAVTLARAATNAFGGIAPPSVPGYLGGQALGAIGAVLCARWVQKHVETRA